MRRCNSYVGIACVNGTCPNALRNEDIDVYKDIYGTTRKQRCDYCGYNEGCKDCAMPEMQGSWFCCKRESKLMVRLK